MVVEILIMVFTAVCVLLCGVLMLAMELSVRAQQRRMNRLKAFDRKVQEFDKKYGLEKRSARVLFLVKTQDGD
jgi:uncharacterized membrane protein YciS (DUF1049 family)